MTIFKTFGSNPADERMLGIKHSPNYKEKQFRNLTETKMMTGDSSMAATILKFLNKPKNVAPPGPIPSVKKDLKKAGGPAPEILWFGHSSYLLKVNGRNILVDPVFSGHASPFSVGAKSFEGSDVYKVEDFPPIHVLVLTHDHYDHLDFTTLLKLKPTTNQIITSLGVGSHLEYWGFDREQITELDWWQEKQIDPATKIIATPARHFSGRGLIRNKTIWSSFVLLSGSWRIFIGGDSGYDQQFAIIGKKYGPFDIALLECGQYNERWADIHMMPEQTAEAAIDLKAKWLLPVHWSKFSLALHPWNEPVQRLLKKAGELNLQVTTPLIGEPVILGETYPVSKWWANL